MKKSLLIIMAIFSMYVSALAQSGNPVASARIVGTDGKAELVFEEALTENFTVEVIDLTGESMFMLKLNCEKEPCSSVVLPIESLRKGIYMVQVVSAGGKTKTLKLQRN
ncbi:MAG: T9SS type A sorting domain-containing protein [Flavobacteriales bacterium]